MANKYEILKSIFGHSEFRDGQRQVVDALLFGSDVLCVMPTGAGKSVCYQVPALIFEGITLVISPLISLMKDQVMSLVQNGVRAAYINSSLTQSQYSKALFNMQCGVYKLVYVAPERLNSPEFINICRSIKIDLLAVDEAHCISQWGQDFRPGYLKIRDFVDVLGYRPVIGAFTATATAAVKADIEDSLKLNEPFKITTGFDRPNLYFSVQKPASKNNAVLKLLEKHRGESAIIYCATRKTVEELCETLNLNGYPAAMYHAGLSDGVRRQNQEDFVYDRKAIMVATNAFGMGIDKSNVSLVVHYNMPKNIESYYQEAGRAGRDGNAADCVLLYSPADVKINRFLIKVSEPNEELDEEQREAVREKDYIRLKQMTAYANTNACLREYILKYFGEDAPDYCGSCSSCETQYEEKDITVEARKILSCIARTEGRYGKKMISDILRGSKNERLLSFGLDSQSTYGLMKEYSDRQLREIMDYLEAKEYTVAVGVDYPTLKITEKANNVLFASQQLTMRVAKNTAGEERTRPAADKSLLGELKALRKRLAEEKGVPAYVIFTDATLAELSVKRPQTPEELLGINGVGKIKLDRYGEAFLRLLSEHGETPSHRLRTKQEKKPFSLTQEQLLHYVYSNDALTVTEIARKLTALANDEAMEPLSARKIFSFLADTDKIYYEQDSRGNRYAAPTDDGELLGMFVEERHTPRGPYTALLCDRSTERYIIMHLEDIVG